jgi:DNA-binding NtrC family response regulator
MINILRPLLQKMGYYFVSADDAETALKKIETTSFNLVFLAHEAKATPVLQHIHSWPGIRRRVSNIILIGEEAVSLHPGAAFRHGINCFFHKKDHANASQLVQAALDYYDDTYKSWRMAAKALGKTHI